MSQHQIEWSSALRSDVGKVREINEDAGLDQPDGAIWAVADGMGGHSAGDLASQLIVKSLAKLTPNDTLSERVDFVEYRILDANRRLHELSCTYQQTTGSTVVVLLGSARHCVSMWVGDSRIYRWRDGVITQLTCDHTQAEEYVTKGLISREVARSHPSGNLLTRAVGAAESLILDIDISEVYPGDRFVLCSDGLDKHVDSEEIATSMRHDKPQIIVDELVELTLARGAYDNVTVCAVTAN